jgi:hypothetical protein
MSLYLDYDAQLEFLTDCYDHIRRIAQGGRIHLLETSEFDDEIDSNLPPAITFDIDENKDNLIRAKLLIFIAIYNQVAMLYFNNQYLKKHIDLIDIFIKAKSDCAIQSMHLMGMTPSEIIKAHRDRQNKSIKFANNFIEPESCKFLREYGFFDAVALVPDDIVVNISETRKGKGL